MASEERLRELEEKYEGFTVYDNRGSKIGKVDDLFVDEKDNEEYIGVKMGFLGRKSTLIPTEIVRVNESEKTIEVSESKDHVKDAPSFDDDEDVTAEYEGRIRRHFGLEALQESSGRGSYGATAAGASTGAAASDRDDERRSDRGSGASGYSTGAEAHDEDREASGTTYRDDSYSETDTRSGGEGSGGTGVSSEGREPSATSSGSTPTTSKQTEETETFQEGGKTKIRRRIIREEVVDADDQA